MMIKDCDRVLNYLVRTGLWSQPGDLTSLARLVVDAGSLVSFLYRLCASEHMRRQASSFNQQVDLYSSTLVDYRQFSSYVEAFLNFLAENDIETILVYEGKYMEEEPDSLVEPCEQETNKDKFIYLVKTNRDYDLKGHVKGQDFVQDRLTAPSLALNIFKQVVRLRKTRLEQVVGRKRAGKIRAFQAFYSPFPVMAKLARDFNCPVLTNSADFIIMDVRAGFLLLDKFWFNLVKSRAGSHRKNRSEPVKSPKRLRSSEQPASSSITLNFNSLFTRQHPGLNAELALNLFPLSSPDLILGQASTLKKIRVFPQEFPKGDFKPDNGKRKNLQNAANRFDLILNFLCAKSPSLVGSLVRSEALLVGSTFSRHFRQIYNYHSIGFHFKTRLRLILRHMYFPVQLNYIEWCLAGRECTADFLLNQLVCCVGRLKSYNYNKFVQLEDLNTKHSTDYLLLNLRESFMSLFTGNAEWEYSINMIMTKNAKKGKEIFTSVRERATLKCFDRDQAFPVIYGARTVCGDKEIDALRPKLDYNRICTRFVNKQDSSKFMRLVFKSKNLNQIADTKLDSALSKFITPEKKFEIAILLNLIEFVFSSSYASDDKYFLQNYTKLKHHFQLAIVNLFIHHHHNIKQQTGTQMKELNILIEKQNFQTVAVPSTEAIKLTGSTISSARDSSGSKLSSAMSVKSSQQQTDNKQLGIRIKHLIELFNKSLEAYFELNAFFEYPMIRLNLHLYYNPILLYNLTLFSLQNPNSKTLISS